jgi:hypothetical protein
MAVGGLITDIDLPRDLESAGPLPTSSKPARRVAGELFDEASRVARPRAGWRLALISRSREEPDALSIGGMAFKSSFLEANLQGLDRVFPFIATEGQELASWAESLPPVKKAAAFIIRYAALKEAERRLEEALLAEFGLEALGALCPGVLPQWPLEAQKSVFGLLGLLPDAMGVSLGERSMWMSPGMTSAGLYFETETDYHNCKLCPQDECPLRRFERCV